jgi:hypothetical protein
MFANFQSTILYLTLCSVIDIISLFLVLIIDAVLMAEAMSWMTVNSEIERMKETFTTYTYQFFDSKRTEEHKNTHQGGPFWDLKQVFYQTWFTIISAYTLSS